jgi:cytochrome c oxidase cbb3-type subunit 2
VVVSVGGIVEIAPLFYLENTIEKVEGMRPYSPLELAGRNIYIREGCYVCHSQMIRPFRDEVERYGHYSLAAESMYDHPFQWGSKRTGPDLARVGDRYSNEWHVEHLIEPRSVVPESIMPSYCVPGDNSAEGGQCYGRSHRQPCRRCALHRRHGRQRGSGPDGASRSQCGYVRARGALSQGQARRFRRRSVAVTEMDALVSYLQMLGTLVDFSTYDEASGYR